MSDYGVLYNILTYTAGVCSLLMNVSPVVAIRQLEKSGTVGAGTITFYGAQMYNCICWASYGAYTMSLPLLIPNSLGNCVSTYSSLVFLTVARREELSGHTLPSTTYLRSLATSLFFLLLSWGHLLLSIVLISSKNISGARTLTGYEGSVAGIVMLSAPLGVFKQIIATKNAASLQPLMVTFAFFNTLFWTIAGLISGDPFIIFPNLFCLAAVVTQIGLLLMYGRKPAEKVDDIKQSIAPVPFD